MIIFLSGKYTSYKTDYQERKKEIEDNINLARKIAIELWENGFIVICPHLNTINFEEDCNLKYDDYVNAYKNILIRCDAIVMLPNWQESKGATIEYNLAKELNIPIYEYPNLPTIFDAEKKYPKQTNEFIITLMDMYRTYLKKNSDYSSANILGTSQIGVITRIWDKVARLMNLFGFEIKIEESIYREPKNPKNESIEDNLIDLANYAIILKILRKKKWGK